MPGGWCGRECVTLASQNEASRRRNCPGARGRCACARLSSCWQPSVGDSFVPVCARTLSFEARVASEAGNVRHPDVRCRGDRNNPVAKPRSVSNLPGPNAEATPRRVFIHPGALRGRRRGLSSDLDFLRARGCRLRRHTRQGGVRRPRTPDSHTPAFGWRAALFADRGNVVADPTRGADVARAAWLGHRDDVTGHGCLPSRPRAKTRRYRGAWETFPRRDVSLDRLYDTRGFYYTSSPGRGPLSANAGASGTARWSAPVRVFDHPGALSWTAFVGVGYL